MVLKVKALYDCSADDDSELSFKKGDIIVDVTKTNEEGWLEGRKEDSNTKGLFPSNYVQLIEEKKIPPKIPPRKIGTNSNNNIQEIDKLPLFETGSSGPIKDPESDIGTSIRKPRKISKNTLAVFESNETLPIKPSINPRSKSSPSLVDNSSSNFIKQTNNNFINKKTESRSATTIFVPQKKQPTKQQGFKHDDDDDNDDDSILLPSMIKKSQTSLSTSKPSMIPPPIAPKPLIQNKSETNLFNKFNNNNSDSNNNLVKDRPIPYSRPPLPSRKLSNTPSISSASSNSNDSLAPQTPPRPFSSTNSSTTSFTKSVAENHTDNSEKAKITTQDQSVKVVQQGISNNFSQLKGEFEKSPYGNKKISAIKSSQSPPPLPSRKNLGLSTDSEIKIPHRPPLYSGIPSDAKKRYELVFDSNKEEDLIDAAVVREIYIRSRLNNKTLYKIWDLLDTDKDGYLNRNEFCIGMFLIDKRLEGNPVPDKLPKELLA